MEATLNVRMEAPLKQRGDSVLREHGISTSEAVRALWRHMAETHSVPDFMTEDSSDKARHEKMAALAELLGSAEGALTHATDAELESLGKARYA